MAGKSCILMCFSLYNYNGEKYTFLLMRVNFPRLDGMAVQCLDGYYKKKMNDLLRNG
jgi:hypothetical protein